MFRVVDAIGLGIFELSKRWIKFIKLFFLSLPLFFSPNMYAVGVS